MKFSIGSFMYIINLLKWRIWLIKLFDSSYTKKKDFASFPHATKWHMERKLLNLLCIIEATSTNEVSTNMSLGMFGGVLQNVIWIINLNQVQCYEHKSWTD